MSFFPCRCASAAARSAARSPGRRRSRLAPFEDKSLFAGLAVPQGGHRQPPGAGRPRHARPRRRTCGRGCRTARRSSPRASSARARSSSSTSPPTPTGRTCRCPASSWRCCAASPRSAPASPTAARRRRIRRQAAAAPEQPHGAAAAADARRLRHPEAAAADRAARAGSQGARPRSRASIIRPATTAPAALRAPST